MGWTGTIINGVLLGGLYGLFGVGLALVFGVTRIVNIMHGEFIALSAFIALGIAAFFPDAHPLLLILPVVVVSLCSAMRCRRCSSIDRCAFPTRWRRSS